MGYKKYTDESKWKVLRSPALTGRRFATWDGVCAAVQAATAC